MERSYYGSIVVIRRSGEDGSVFPMVIKECVLGRDEDCDIRIQLAIVSSRHAYISVNENNGEATLTAFGSNGVFLNQSRLPKNEGAPLNHGDIFMIGDRFFRWEYPMSKSSSSKKFSKRNSRVLKSMNTPKGSPKVLASTDSRKRVSFGPAISPEYIDKTLPPSTPVKKGGSMPSADAPAGTPVSKMRKRIAGKVATTPLHDSISEDVNEPKSVLIRHNNDTPRVKISSGYRTSPRTSPDAKNPASSSSPKSAKRVVTKVSTPLKSPKIRTPSKKSPKLRTPLRKSNSPTRRRSKTSPQVHGSSPKELTLALDENKKPKSTVQLSETSPGTLMKSSKTSKASTETSTSSTVESVIASPKSPKTLAKSPKTPAKSFKTPTKSSKTPAKSPKTPAKSPKTLVKSSKTLSKSPKTLSKSPKTLAKSPKTPAKSPKTLAKSPKTPAKSPKTPAKSPKTQANTLTKSTRTPTKSLKTPAKSPKTPTKSPKTPTKSPLLVTMLSKSPKTFSKSPQASVKRPSKRSFVSHKSPSYISPVKPGSPNKEAEKLEKSIEMVSAKSRKVGRPSLKSVEKRKAADSPLNEAPVKKLKYEPSAVLKKDPSSFYGTSAAKTPRGARMVLPKTPKLLSSKIRKSRVMASGKKSSKKPLWADIVKKNVGKTPKAIRQARAAKLSEEKRSYHAKISKKKLKKTKKNLRAEFSPERHANDPGDIILGRKSKKTSPTKIMPAGLCNTSSIPSPKTKIHSPSLHKTPTDSGSPTSKIKALNTVKLGRSRSASKILDNTSAPAKRGRPRSVSGSIKNLNSIERHTSIKEAASISAVKRKRRLSSKTPRSTRQSEHTSKTPANSPAGIESPFDKRLSKSFLESIPNTPENLTLFDFDSIKTPNVPIETFVSPLQTDSPEFKSVKKMKRGRSSRADHTNVETNLNTSKQAQKNYTSDGSNVKAFKVFEKTQKGPKCDYSNVSGLKKLMATPKAQRSPKSDYSNVFGLKKLMASPRKAQRSPKSDYTNVTGLKKLMATPKKAPKSPKSDYTNVVGLKKLMATPKNATKSPKSDYTNVIGLKKLMATPKNGPKSPKSDYTQVVGLKKLLSTPKNFPKSPKSDYSQIVGLKKLLASPRKPPKSPKSDYTNVSGLKKMLATPRKPGKSPKADYTNVVGLRRLLDERRLVSSPKSSYDDLVGISELMRSPDLKREENIELIMASPEFKSLSARKKKDVLSSLKKVQESPITPSRRGRPRKSDKGSENLVEAEMAADTQLSAKRTMRSRKRKSNDVPEKLRKNQINEDNAEDLTVTKRKRGRKIQSPNEICKESPKKQSRKSEEHQISAEKTEQLTEGGKRETRRKRTQEPSASSESPEKRKKTSVSSVTDLSTDSNDNLPLTRNTRSKRGEGITQDKSQLSPIKGKRAKKVADSNDDLPMKKTRGRGNTKSTSKPEESSTDSVSVTSPKLKRGKLAKKEVVKTPKSESNARNTRSRRARQPELIDESSKDCVKKNDKTRREKKSSENITVRTDEKNVEDSPIKVSRTRSRRHVDSESKSNIKSLTLDKDESNIQETNINALSIDKCDSSAREVETTKEPQVTTRGRRGKVVKVSEVVEDKKPSPKSRKKKQLIEDKLIEEASKNVELIEDVKSPPKASKGRKRKTTSTKDDSKKNLLNELSSEAEVKMKTGQNPVIKSPKIKSPKKSPIPAKRVTRSRARK